MMNKKIITWACAGAIILAGVGGASVITARNLDKFREAERESNTAISELLTSTQPAPNVGTTAPTTTKQVTAPQTTKRESGSKTTAPAEVQTTKITWAYDAELSKQVAELIIAKRTDLQYDLSLFKERGAGNFVHDGIISTENSAMAYIDKVNGDNVAKEIVNSWTNLNLNSSRFKSKRFCLAAYRYSNGYYFVAFC